MFTLVLDLALQVALMERIAGTFQEAVEKADDFDDLSSDLHSAKSNAFELARIERIFVNGLRSKPVWLTLHTERLKITSKVNDPTY